MCALLLVVLALQEGVPSQEELSRAIHKLGSESIEERERATAFLRNAVDDAWPLLVKARKHHDKEVASRAEEILRPAMQLRHKLVGSIAFLLKRGCSRFEQDQLPSCITLCRSILTLEPEYLPARQFLMESKAVLSGNKRREELFSRIKEWKAAIDCEAGLIPMKECVRVYRPADWPVISKRIDDVMEWRLVELRLERLRIDLRFKKAKFDDVVEYLKEFSGLYIVVDAAVRDAKDFETRIDVNLRNLTLKNALSEFLTPFGLVYVVTTEHAVVLTTPERAKQLGV